MKKRILSLLLVFVMVLGMLPTTAFAAEPKVTVTMSGYEVGANINAFDAKFSNGSSVNPVFFMDEDQNPFMSGKFEAGKTYYAYLAYYNSEVGIDGSAAYTAADFALEGIEGAEATVEWFAEGPWMWVIVKLPQLAEAAAEPKVTVTMSGYEVGANINAFDAQFSNGSSANPVFFVDEDQNLIESGNFEAGKTYYANLAYYNSEVGIDGVAAYTAADFALEGIEGAEATVDWFEDGPWMWVIVKLPQLTEAAAPTTYGITVSDTENGTVTADKAEAAEGETVTLTVTPATGYELESLTYTPEDGEAEDITEAKSFTMPASTVTVAATFKAASPKVVLKLTGYEVMADAANITLSGEDCNFLDLDYIGLYTRQNTGSAYKVSGSLLPDTQYYLFFNFNSISNADWSGLTKDDVSLEGLCDAPVTFNNQYGYAYKNMTGWFELPKLQIPSDANVIIQAENGKVYPSTYKASAGDTVTLTFAPDENYVLGTLTAADANGDPVEISDSYTFIMPETAVTVTAVFTKPTVVWTMGSASGKPGDTIYVTMSLATNAAQYGAIYFRPSYDQSAISYLNNSKSDITVASDSGFSISSMKTYTADDGSWNYFYTKSNTANTPQGVIFTISYKIKEDAQPGEYPITLAALGNKAENGTYFYVSKKVVDCDYSVVPGVITVEGNAAPTTYGITVSATENGTVTADKAEAAEGDTVTLTVTPNAGYMVDTLTVGGADVTAQVADGKYIFEMPAEAVTVAAAFKEIPAGTKFAIRLPEAAPEGSVTADKTEAAEGETVTLTVAPTTGYLVESLTVNGVAATKTGENIYTFTMPAEEAQVSIVFKGDNRKGIYVTPNEDGTIVAKLDGETVEQAAPGKTVTLEVTPKEGYVLSQLRAYYGNYFTEVELTRVEENVYTFVMPAELITIEAYYKQTVIPGKSALMLGSKEDAYPGDLISIPVSVSDAPTGPYAAFELKTILPDGWTIVGLEGQPINSYGPGDDDGDGDGKVSGHWTPEQFDTNRWGMGIVRAGSAGLYFPANAELFKLKILIPTNTAPGTYKLETVSGTLTMGRVDSTDGSFAQNIHGYVTVLEAPAEKIQLVAPELKADQLRSYENLIEIVNAPACLQDTAATIQFQYSKTPADESSWSQWTAGTEVEIWGENDEIIETPKIISKNLDDNTKYYVRARYVAYNTEYYKDSAAGEAVEITTTAWIKDPMTVTLGGDAAIAVGPGETFTVPVVVDHNFGATKFFNFDFKQPMNTDQFTLVTVTKGKDVSADDFQYSTFSMPEYGVTPYVRVLTVYGGAPNCKAAPEGELFLMTYKVKDGVAAGEYQLNLPENPVSMLYFRGQMDNNTYQCSYPVTANVTPVTITVKGKLEAPVLTAATADDDSVTVTAPAAVEGATVEYAISTKANETTFTWQESNVFTGLAEKTTYYVYARYKADADSTNADSPASAALEVATVNPTAAYTVASVEANPGKSVDVAVTLEHTIVKTADNFVIVPEAAEGLTLTAAKAGKNLGEGWTVAENDGVVTVYRDEAAVVPAGEVIILTYTVSEDAEAGDLAVTLNAFGDDGCVFVNGETALRVDGTVTAGKVTVKALNPGDLNYDITVSATENGTVTADKAAAAEGETVTLTVTPAEGYELDTLTVNGEEIEGTTFTMPAQAVTVTATFKAVAAPKVTFTLTGYELGKPASEVQITATNEAGADVLSDWTCTVQDKKSETMWGAVEGNFQANKDYRLIVRSTKSDYNGYTADNFALTGAETTETTYKKQFTHEAVFVLKQLEAAPATTYGITVSATENGTVTADKATAAEGETVTLTVTPAQYYELDTLNVTDAQGETVTLAEDNSFVMPAGAVTVSATFKQTSGMQQYFTVTVNGVEYPAQYIGVQYYDEKGRDCEAFRVVLPEAATSMTVAAIEDMLTIKELYVLNMQNISIRSDDTSYELPLTGAVTIYKLNAYCSGNNRDPSYCYLRVEMPAYGITVNAGANGKASADKTEAAKGETIKLTVTPNAGYMVDTLTVTDAEGKPIEVEEDNTFVMPGSAVTVDVTFKEVPPVYYNVTIEASQNGTVTADKETAILNDTVKLTVTPAEGYTLKSLTVKTVDGAAIEVAEDNTFQMPAADVKVTATFKAGSTARVNLKITGYEIGKVAKYASVKMYDTNGNDVTAGEWYCCIVDSNEGCNWNIGELKADTRYWLRIERYISGYKASDFALMDMEAVSVTDSSGGGNFLIYIELPQLKAPAVPYAIDTSKIVDGTVTAKVGGNAVTEATAGSTVTLTAAPNEGFTLGEVRVLDATGAEITVTGTGENTYIFVMPESAVQIHALFRQNVAEDKSTLTLGEAADVLAGDKIVIPVNVANAPAGNFYVFDMNVVLPEGWTLIGALEGADARLNSTDSWMPTPSDSGYGLVAQYDGNNGVRFPNGEVMKLVIQVPAGATPGVYKLDVVSAGLSMDRVDSETSSFAQYIDGHVTVKAGPTEKTKLTTPAITDGMILAWEDMVESRNVPACQEDPNATVEYRLAESQEALETAEWILGTEPANYDQVYTDTIRWIQEGLKANTKYYLQIRYRAYNTNYFFDSDPCTTEFTTKAWIEEPVKITTGSANARPGDTFTVTMNFEHAFDNQAFISKDYDFKFNDEHFTLQGINWTSNSGNKLPEGDVAELTFTVKDGVESGEYELALTSTNPFTLRYNRDGSGYYKHNREYPVNHTFTSGKITVLGRLAAPELTGYTATDDTVTVTAPEAVTNGKVEYAISTKANETNFTWQDSNVFENLGEKTTYYVYARNVAIDKTLNGDSVVSAALEVETVNPTAAYTVDSVEGNPGKTVDVAITLEHTIVKTADNFVIVPNAAEGLTLTGAKAGKDLGAGWSVLVDEGTVTVYRDEAAVIPTGEVIILTYTVSEEAEAGDLEVTLNAFGDDGCVFVNGETALRVDGTVTAGKVTVETLNPGDLNKDGEVNMIDYVCLRRYLASWPDYTAETLNLAAGDLNDDGNVDLKDAFRLSHLLAN